MDGNSNHIRTDELISFLLGIHSINRLKTDEIIKVCADRAYRDMCRTLKFNKQATKKGDFKKDVSQIIIDRIAGINERNHDYSFEDNSKSVDYKGFDLWHYNTCIEVKERISKDYKEGVFEDNHSLTVGQIQKWINMTIKYLWVLGKWNDREDYLHIPVDNYILEAACCDREQELYDGCCVHGLGLTKNQLLTEPWSKCDNYDEYMKFQITVKDACRSIGDYKSDLEIPCYWESKAWMAIASKKAQDDTDRVEN